jgi:hypothetical protein
MNRLGMAVVLVAGCTSRQAYDTEEPDDGASCEEFCKAVQETCPSDTECLHSCENGTFPPDQEDVSCAQLATSCEETNACFNGFY